MDTYGNKENVYIDMENRLFYLSGDIDCDSISKINFNLIKLIMEDNKNKSTDNEYVYKPVYLYINSYGGMTDDGWSLIDIINNSSTPIYTICTGYAYSCGFNIFIAGHKRFMTHNAKLCYHTVHVEIDFMSYDKFKDEYAQVTADNNKLENHIARYTKMNEDLIDDIRTKRKDFYMTAEEALSLGCVDEIISNISEIK